MYAARITKIIKKVQGLTELTQFIAIDQILITNNAPAIEAHLINPISQISTFLSFLFNNPIIFTLPLNKKSFQLYKLYFKKDLKNYLSQLIY